MSSPTSLTTPRQRTAAGVPARLSESISIQQEVFIVALVRLSKALASPNHIKERIEMICSKLGISLPGLASVVGERLVKERTLLDVYVGSDGVFGKQQASGIGEPRTGEGAVDALAARPPQGPLDTTASNTLSAATQELCSAFFAQEVIQGERALEDARTRLAALWDRLMELLVKRDQILEHLKVTPEQRRMLAVLARALEQAQEEQESSIKDGNSCLAKENSSGMMLPPRWLGMREGHSNDGASSSSSPASTSRLRPPKAGLRHCTQQSSNTTFTSAPGSSANTSTDDRSMSSKSVLPTTRAVLASEVSAPSAGRGSENEDERALEAAYCGPEAGGGLGGSSFAEDLRLQFVNSLNQHDVKALRDQRDALMRRLSFTCQQCTDALGDKPIQIERLTQEVDSLRTTCDALRVELEEERRGNAEEIKRWQSEAEAMKEKAASAISKVEEEKRKRNAAEARAVSMVAGVAREADCRAEAAAEREHRAEELRATEAKLSYSEQKAASEMDRLRECLRESSRKVVETVEAKLQAEREAHGALQAEASSATQLAAMNLELRDLKKELARLKQNEAAKDDAVDAAAAKATSAEEVIDALHESLETKELDLAALRENHEQSGKREATARDQVMNELQTLLETAQKKISKTDRDLAACSQEAAAMVRERDSWAVKSGEWEAEATRLESASNAAVEKAERARTKCRELEAEVEAVKRKFVATEKGLARADKLRAEEVTVSRERALALDAAERSVRRLTGEVLEVKAAASKTIREAALATSTVSSKAWTAGRSGLLDELTVAQESLYEVVEEKEEAVRALKEGASAETEAPESTMKLHRQRSGAVFCNGDDRSDGTSPSAAGDSWSGDMKDSGKNRWDDAKASVQQEKYRSTEASHGVPLCDSSGIDGDGTAPTSHNQSGLVLSDGIAAEAAGVREGEDLREVTNALVVANDVLCPPEKIGSAELTKGNTLPISMDVEMDGMGGVGEAAGGDGRCNNERVCGVCGAPPSASRKLFEFRCELDRVRAATAEANVRVIEANERADKASEYTIALHEDVRKLEEALGDRTSELEEARTASRRMSTAAEEAAARLATAEALKSEAETELEKERKASAAVVSEGATRCAERDTTQVALDGCRAALAERSRELGERRQPIAARDRMHTAAEESGTGKASASAEALAKARQEADEVRERLLIEESLRRRAEADLKEAKGALNVGVARCEETKGENEVLTAAVVSSKEGEDKSALMGGKAKVRYKADLAIAQEQRDRLEAERRKLQKRVTDMEDEKRESDAAMDRLEQAVACHREQVDSEAALRQGLEQRLAIAEDAVAAATTALKTTRRQAADQEGALREELRQAGEAVRAAVAAAKVQEAENANLKLAEVSRKLADSVEASTVREGEVAVLRARLRSAEDMVDTVRREVLLQGRAESVVQMSKSGKEIAALQAQVEAHKLRCEDQQRALTALASSREEEADAGQVARALLAKEKLAATQAQHRVYELELEVDRLSSSLKAVEANTLEPRIVVNAAAYRMHDGRPQPRNPVPTFSASPVNGPFRRHHDKQQCIDDPNGICAKDAPNTSQVTRSTLSGGIALASSVGPRESKERERTRHVLSSLEESARSSREEADFLTRRVAQLRAIMGKAERRADEAEAAAAAARAAAVAEAEAVKIATADAEISSAARYEAEQQARAAERREEEAVMAYERRIQSVQGAEKVARVELAEARDELIRLRRDLGDSNKRAAALEEQLVMSATDLRGAEAARLALQTDLLRRLGGCQVAGGGPEGASGASCRLGKNAWQSAGPSVPPTSVPFTIPQLPVLYDIGLKRGMGCAIADNCGGEKVTTLQQKLEDGKSQASFSELIRVAEEAVANCNRRCDERVRTAIAAGTLTSAYCRRRGIEAGRDETVIAAGRLDLVRRCFGALRTEALRSSRDRIARRHETVLGWVKETVEVAGEEILSLKKHGGERAAASNKSVSRNAIFE